MCRDNETAAPSSKPSVDIRRSVRCRAFSSQPHCHKTYKIDSILENIAAGYKFRAPENFTFPVPAVKNCQGN